MSEINWDFEASMTAELLIDRGRCCEANCIHCPYGYTVKKLKLKFYDYEEKHNSFYQFLIDKKVNDFKEYKLLVLKEIIIGFIKVDKVFVTDTIFRPGFEQQNITKELIESYYFY